MMVMKRPSLRQFSWLLGEMCIRDRHQTNNAKKMSPWQILRNRQFWGIALPRFLAEPAWGTFNAWIPLFMFKVCLLYTSRLRRLRRGGRFAAADPAGL